MESATKADQKSLSTIPLTLDDYKKAFENFHTGYDTDEVLKKAKVEAEKNRGKEKAFSSETNIYKAMSLFEFDNGSLMLNSVSEIYRTFSIDFSRNLQKEYDCRTPSEKATAELVAINFIRTLAIQRNITANLDRESYSDINIRRLEVLSKELDRANRHYLNSLQTLKMIKQPMLEVNIKTQTAIVGQNQLVQTNNK
ncbi:MAG TPA: hypothetical protein VMR41_05195 [Patescibacteria group bacterium]|nr:hypothetical protein [Patescibacteria group bacterium]